MSNAILGRAVEQDIVREAGNEYEGKAAGIFCIRISRHYNALPARSREVYGSFRMRCMASDTLWSSKSILPLLLHSTCMQVMPSSSIDASSTKI